MRIRCQFLPFVSLGICVILLAVLWGRRVNTANTVGEAQATETHITSRAAGILMPIEQAIQLRQRVEKGQTVARVDENPIVSPVTGFVSNIRCSPGQTIRAGETILTITSEQPALVLAYVRQDHRIKPVVRMPVELRSLVSGGPVYRTTIAQVGMSFEPIPHHQARDQKVTEWGIPVMIPIPTAMQADLRPGELVEVRLKSSASPSVQAGD
jgi:multidrug resistance efflux pump